MSPRKEYKKSQKASLRVVKGLGMTQGRPVWELHKVWNVERKISQSEEEYQSTEHSRPFAVVTGEVGELLARSFAAWEHGLEAGLSVPVGTEVRYRYVVGGKGHSLEVGNSRIVFLTGGIVRKVEEYATVALGAVPAGRWKEGEFTVKLFRVLYDAPKLAAQGGTPLVAKEGITPVEAISEGEWLRREASRIAAEKQQAREQALREALLRGVNEAEEAARRAENEAKLAAILEAARKRQENNSGAAE